MSELTSKDVFLTSHKRGQKFEESIATFVRKATEMLQQKVSEEGLIEFSHDLGALYGEGISFLYFSRKHRDEALAKAYEAHPRKTMNSEEQTAVCRAEAGPQVRLHEAIKEILEATKVRLSVCRQHLQMKQMER